MQIVTWIGAAWYEFEYGFNRDSFDADHHYTTWQQVCIYVDVICSPTAGLGNSSPVSTVFMIFVRFFHNLFGGAAHGICAFQVQN